MTEEKKTELDGPVFYDRGVVGFIGMVDGGPSPVNLWVHVDEISYIKTMNMETASIYMGNGTRFDVDERFAGAILAAWRGAVIRPGEE